MVPQNTRNHRQHPFPNPSQPPDVPPNVNNIFPKQEPAELALSSTREQSYYYDSRQDLYLERESTLSPPPYPPSSWEQPSLPLSQVPLSQRRDQPLQYASYSTPLQTPVSAAVDAAMPSHLITISTEGLPAHANYCLSLVNPPTVITPPQTSIAMCDELLRVCPLSTSAGHVTHPTPFPPGFSPSDPVPPAPPPPIPHPPPSNMILTSPPMSSPSASPQFECFLSSGQTNNSPHQPPSANVCAPATHTNTPECRMTENFTPLGNAFYSSGQRLLNEILGSSCQPSLTVPASSGGGGGGEPMITSDLHTAGADASRRFEEEYNALDKTLCEGPGGELALSMAASLSAEGVSAPETVGPSCERSVGRVGTAVGSDAGVSSGMDAVSTFANDEPRSVSEDLDTGSESGGDSSGKCMTLTHERQKENRRFKCGRCDARFFRRYDMRKHEAAVHRQLRPHRCEICGNGFAQKHHLSRHKRSVHARLRQFSCRICPANFSRREHMYSHLRLVHEVERVHSCILCESYYSERGELTSHLKDVHKVKSSRAAVLAKWQLESGKNGPSIEQLLRI